MTPGFTAELALDRKFGDYRGNQAGPNLSKPATVSPASPSNPSCHKDCVRNCTGIWGCETFCTWYCGGRTEM
jgi:hypothetical protein